MMCPRCQGLMITETAYAGDELRGKYTYSHCIICGFYTDAQMQANRNNMPLTVRTTWQDAKTMAPIPVDIVRDTVSNESLTVKERASIA